MQGRAAVPAVEGVPDHFAIYGDVLWLSRPILARVPVVGLERLSHPGQEAALERFGVDQHEHAAERVVRGNAAV